MSRDLLVELYLNQNLSILDVSRKIGNVSNVTVRKWLNHYSIPIKTHSQAIKNSHTQKNYSAFNNPETQRKVKETFIEKYGTPYHPNMMTSNTEEEVREFFNSLGCNMTKSRVLGCELDGLDENILVAFEYCGHYWHNEHSPTPKTRQYHNQKHVQCQLHGIQLFTIFEYEWTTRKDQVKNFIRGALNKNTSKLYARECDLKIFTEKNPEINAFLDRYHIQGYPNSWFQCNALFYKQEIVGVMTFSNHHRQNQENVIVLSRLCWKTDLSVIGGSSRLFAYRPANKTIVSWSDNRWSSKGGVYTRLGFDLDKEYGPDYIYVDGKKWKSKQSMQKRYINARDDQTEYERAFELGWSRMWDCGKKKWMYGKSSDQTKLISYRDDSNFLPIPKKKRLPKQSTESSPLKGIPRSQEDKDKISQGTKLGMAKSTKKCGAPKGTIPWNKKKTP